MFKDRTEAGQLLVGAISNFNLSDALVIAIPRGGVIVAAEIAKALRLPLKLIFIKKVGHPGNPEYSIGAIGKGGRELALDSEYSQNEIVQQINSALLKMRKQIKAYGHSYEECDIKNKVVLLVDDGAATGNSILLAVKELRSYSIKKIIVLLPVCPLDTYNKIANAVDQIICLDIPINFNAVGQFYEDFDQVDDEIINNLLLNYGFYGNKKG
jgi:putative phosphoribosyl transferase